MRSATSIGNRGRARASTGSPACPNPSWLRTSTADLARTQSRSPERSAISAEALPASISLFVSLAQTFGLKKPLINTMQSFLLCLGEQRMMFDVEEMVDDEPYRFFG